MILIIGYRVDEYSKCNNDENDNDKKDNDSDNDDSNDINVTAATNDNHVDSEIMMIMLISTLIMLLIIIRLNRKTIRTVIFT